MRAWLAAAAAIVAAADCWLAVVTWSRRAVLAGVLAVAGPGFVGFALASGLRGDAPPAVLIALALLIVACAPFGLGQAVQRLLDAQADDGPLASTTERQHP